MIRRPTRSTRTDTLFPYTTRAAAARENVEQTADLVVEIGDVGEIRAPGGTHLRLGDLEAAEIDRLQQALAVRILLLIRDRRDLGEQRRTVLVEFPGQMGRASGREGVCPYG